MSPDLIAFLDNITDSERETSISPACPAATFCQSITDVPESECEVVVNLYKSTNGDGRKTARGRFQGTAIGKRDGITVEGKEDKHVTAIDLHGDSLV